MLQPIGAHTLTIALCSLGLSACATTRTLSAGDAALELLGPPARSYEDPAEQAMIRARLPESPALDAAMKTLTLPEPKVRDRSVDAAAAIIAAAYGENERMPTRAFVDWALWRSGVAGKAMSWWVWSWKAHEDVRDKELAAALRKWSRETSELERTRYVGVARVRTGQRREAQVVLEVERPVELDATPKRPEAPWTLRGRVGKALERPKVFLDLGGLGYHEATLAAEGDGSFAVPLPLPETPGTHYLAVSYALPDGTRTSCLFPVHVAMDEPAAPPEIFLRRDIRPDGDGSWRTDLLATYNRMRAERHLPLLAADAGLESMANAHAQRIRADRDNDSDPSLERDLQARGYASSHALHFTTTDGLESLAWWVDHDPSRRPSALDPKLLLLGIGYAKREKDVVVVEYLGATRTASAAQSPLSP